MIDNENEYPSFDLSYLNQVFQGNKEMIHQIISMFVKQVPDYFSEMQECVVRADFSALHPLAHKAKSSIAMLGLKDMEALVLEIEKKSKNGDKGAMLEDLVSRVVEDYNGISVQLGYLLKE